MAGLCLGSLGPEVTARQRQLIQLGVLAGEAHGVFDVAMAQAVRDLQRRWLRKPDGLIGSVTAAALDRATAAAASEPVSAFRRLHLQGQKLAAEGQASDDHLPLLDQGLAASPLRLDPSGFAASLAAAAAMGAAVWGAGTVLQVDGVRGLPLLAPLVAGLTLLGGAVYVGLLRVLAPGDLRALAGAVRRG